MDKILVKQVEGAVDVESRQQITGEKTFTSATIFDKQSGAHNVIIRDGFLYWATDPKRLDQEGNFRYGIVSGNLKAQKYLIDSWVNI